MTQRKSRVLAVDPSLTASGWALFDVHRQVPLAVGIIASGDSSQDLSVRLAALQQQIHTLLLSLRLGEEDFLLCEGPAPLVLNPSSAVKVEQVRSIFEILARSLGLTVPGRLNPRTIHVEMLGLRGKQLARKTVKQCARDVVDRLYGAQLKDLYTESVTQKKKKLSQDIVDALLIGAVASAKLSQALLGGLNPTEQFATKRGRSSRANGSTARVRWTEADLQKVLYK